MTEADEGTPPVGWSLLLPPQWWHVPLDHRRQGSVRALADRMLADSPRDSSAPLRRALVADLDAAVQRAVEAGAHDLYLMSALSYGLPVGASCLATVVDRPLPVDTPAGLVAEMLALHPGDESGLIDIGGTEVACLRRVCPGTGSMPEAGEDPAELMTAFPSARLDVHVPYPGREATLLLSFSTTVPTDVQSAMMVLFEAIAGSLRWDSGRPAQNR